MDEFMLNSSKLTKDYDMKFTTFIETVGSISQNWSSYMMCDGWIHDCCCYKWQSGMLWYFVIGYWLLGIMVVWCTFNEANELYQCHDDSNHEF